MKEVVVIGAGLSGLVVASLLAKKKYKVTVLEQAHRVGGCLQSFEREGVSYDTGFHFVSGLVPFTPVWRLFRRLGLLSLPWLKQREVEVHLGDTTYHLPCSLRRCKRYLIKHFPDQKQNLNTYFRTLDTIAHCPLEKTLPYWERNAWKWLSAIITDPRLINVLSSMSLIINLRKDSLPLFSYAEIMWGLLSSTRRIQGGGAALVNRLQSQLEKAGGQIVCCAAVKYIQENESGVTGVQLEDGRSFPAEVVISSVHPYQTMRLLSETSHMRSIYRRRVSQLPSTPGCFTVNIRLQKGVYDLPSHPIYIHAEEQLWDRECNGLHAMIYTYPEQQAVDILFPSDWKKWNVKSGGREAERLKGNRPESEYQALKQREAEKGIALAQTVLPNLKEHMISYSCSTPRTWYRYTKTHEGSAYGTIKDYRSIETTLLSPKTPLKGLYLTGQSLVQHGVVGTTLSAYFTYQSVLSQISNQKSEIKI